MSSYIIFRFCQHDFFIKLLFSVLPLYMWYKICKDRVMFEAVHNNIEIWMPELHEMATPTGFLRRYVLFIT